MAVKPLNQLTGWVNRVENLDICRRNQVWVGDITYVRLKEQFVCASVLMDVFTRVVRGWQVSRHLTEPLTLRPLQPHQKWAGHRRGEHLTEPLTLRPLQQALTQSVPEIHHSDQGVQYLSKAYVSTLTDYGIDISLAHRGRPWDNGYAERLIRTLKEEEVHLNEYDDIIEAKHRIGRFIEQGLPHATMLLNQQAAYTASDSMSHGQGASAGGGWTLAASLQL